MQALNNKSNWIDSWMKESNLNPPRIELEPPVTHYGIGTTFEEVMFEGDEVLESYLMDSSLDLAEKFEDYSEEKLNDTALLSVPGVETIKSVLREERDIWKLVKIIYRERALKAHALNSNEEIQPPKSVFPLSEHALVQFLLEKSPKLSEALCIRSWLEETAPKFDVVEPEKGGWSETYQTIKTLQRSGSSEITNLVDKFDPDATYRLNKCLKTEDEKFEINLNRSMYYYIRMGKIDKAMELAESSDQPWRAASFRGGVYFRDPLFDVKDKADRRIRDEVGTSIGDEVGTSLEGETAEASTLGETEPDSDIPGGNMNRLLWKATCFSIATNPKNDKYEKAFYSVLCGDLDNLIPVCKSWKDQLWAYYNCMMESQVDKFIKQCFPEKYIKNFPGPSTISLDGDVIFARIEQDGDFGDTAFSGGIFDKLKKYIILNTLDEFLGEINEILRTKGFMALEINFFRLLVLVVIYLKTLGFADQNEVKDKLIQYYIDRLISIGEHKIAILYCSRLSPEAKLKSYIKILSGIEGSIAEKKECVRYGSIHGIEVKDVYLITADACLTYWEDKNPVSREFHLDRLDLSIEPQPNENITKQIKAFEWISHEPAYFKEAIVMCNSLCRKFLLTGKLWAANKLLTAMPKNLARHEWNNDSNLPNSSNNDQKQAVHEYTNYCNLLEAYRCINKWTFVMEKKPTGSQEDKEWVGEANNAAKKAETALRYSLNSDWMLNCLIDEDSVVENTIKERLKEDALMLRKIYIPEMIFSLHDVLMSTKDIAIDNIKKVLEMSELVAGEKLGLYKEFLSRPVSPGNYRNDLGKLTLKFRAAGRALLDLERQGTIKSELFPRMSQSF